MSVVGRPVPTEHRGDGAVADAVAGRRLRPQVEVVVRALGDLGCKLGTLSASVP